VTWVLANLATIGTHLWTHLATALPAIVAAFFIALPIGVAAHRMNYLRGPIVASAGLLYAIPSLPLFVVLPILLGTRMRATINVVIAMTIYGVALMVRSVADGLDSVPSHARDAAIGFGYSPRQVFFSVELPLAGPVLLAGLRVVAVSTISLTTVGAVLGIPSLGMLFTDGFQRGIVAEVLAGIVLTVVLALVVDRMLVLLGRIAMPWTRQVAT
jgi:osmoprotectant transport system permease protein